MNTTLPTPQQLAAAIDRNADLYMDGHLSLAALGAAQSALWLLAERDGLCEAVRGWLRNNL